MARTAQGLHALPAFLRTYKTEKFIRVDVPRVGIFFRVCQLLAFGLVFLNLYINDGWALSEVPGGMVAKRESSAGGRLPRIQASQRGHDHTPTVPAAS